MNCSHCNAINQALNVPCTSCGALTVSMAQQTVIRPAPTLVYAPLNQGGQTNNTGTGSVNNNCPPPRNYCYSAMPAWAWWLVGVLAFALVSILGYLAFAHQMDGVKNVIATAAKTVVAGADLNTGSVLNSQAALKTSIDGVNTSVQAGNGKLDALKTGVDATTAAVNTGNGKLDTLHNDNTANGTKLDALKTSVDGVNTNLVTANATLKSVSWQIAAQRRDALKAFAEAKAAVKPVAANVTVDNKTDNDSGSTDE